MIISKSRKVSKLFFILTFSGLIMYVILAFYSLHKSHILNAQERRNGPSVSQKINQRLKYILFETKNPELFSYIEGQKLFIDYQCPQFLCYLTTNKNLLSDKKKFDAVVINVTDVAKMVLPLSRPKNQIYIFYGMEPSDQVPVCNKHADNFFNYTWSYKLNSDIVSPFFVVRDMNDSAVAPSLYAEWTMSLPKSSLKLEEVMKFKSKNKSVAMLVKDCKDNEGKIFASKLREALKVYSEVLDVFGCKRSYPLAGSDAVITGEYYYVLVNAGTAQDYVTDKVLKAYWNNAVPIVRARADLTKFLPPGSYINAHLQTPEQIAAIVHYSINNPSVYRSFFKWRNFYTFHKREEFDGICQICSLLNDRALFYSNSSVHLREWWESSSTNNIKCA